MDSRTDKRCVLAAVAVFLCLGSTAAAPTKTEDVVYDQRQNGTENYRLHIDGVVIAVAPAEILVGLADLVDLADFMPSSSGGNGGDSGGSDGSYGGDIEGLVPPEGEGGSTTEEASPSDGEGAASEGGASPVRNPDLQVAEKPADASADSSSGNTSSSNNNSNSGGGSSLYSNVSYPTRYPLSENTPPASKPTKKLKGKLVLSRWLLPLLRRL